MTKSQWQALGILVLASPILLMMTWFFYFHFVKMAPQSQDPDYYSVYWIEHTLYYGSDCGKANLYLDTAIPGLIECREDPYLRFINKRNGTSLLVEKPWDIRCRWLPSGERVFVDYANGYVFWAEDGKVTNFVKLNPQLESQLLESPPAPAKGDQEEPSVPRRSSDASELESDGQHPVATGRLGAPTPMTSRENPR